jgi:hypothetical protein
LLVVEVVEEVKPVVVAEAEAGLVVTEPQPGLP